MTRVIRQQQPSLPMEEESMERDVSGEMAKLTGLTVAVSAVAGVAWAPVIGLMVSVGMLALITISLVSPAGPTMLLDQAEL